MASLSTKQVDTTCALALLIEQHYRNRLVLILQLQNISRRGFVHLKQRLNEEKIQAYKEMLEKLILIRAIHVTLFIVICTGVLIFQ